ncbi:hypothetical protein [Streptomyces sp. NPDC002067]
MNDSPQQPYGSPDPHPGQAPHPGPYAAPGLPPQAYEQPPHGGPAHGHPYDQGHAGQTPQGQPPYGRTEPGQAPYGQEYGGPAPYAQTPHGQGPAGPAAPYEQVPAAPSYEQNPAAPYGQAPAAPYEQVPHAQPGHEQVAYGQPGHPQSGHGQAAYGQAQGAPQAVGAPYEQVPHSYAPPAAVPAPGDGGAASHGAVRPHAARGTGADAAQDAPRPDAPQDLSRLAPNQRARAEGRSPIIPPGIRPAALTAVLALLLAVTAPLPEAVRCVPVVLLQAVTAAGWYRLNGMWPARQGIALAFLAGVVTDVALLATDREDAPLVGLGTLGVWCLFVLVLQLRNRSGADERMYALTAGLTSAALAVLAAGQLSALPDAVVVGAAAVALAVLVRALPLPGPVTAVLALLAAAGAGAAAGRLNDFGVMGAALGLATGACALIGLRVASYDYPSRFVHLTAGVALPLALAAPAVHLLGPVLS